MIKKKCSNISNNNDNNNIINKENLFLKNIENQIGNDDINNNNSKIYFKKGFNRDNTQSQFIKQKENLDSKGKKNNLYFKYIKSKQNYINKNNGFNKYELIELNNNKSQMKINSSKILNNYVENNTLKISSSRKINQTINQKKLIHNNTKIKEKIENNINKEKYNTTFYDINKNDKHLGNKKNFI